jgi:hypothetical protein
MDDAMYVQIIGGSDKTTTTVGTGSQEYHPVYVSNGILKNEARRAHGRGLTLVGFLPIPKGEYFSRVLIRCSWRNIANKKERKSPRYQTFCRQLYHACLRKIFEPLLPYMEATDLVRCPDGHLRHAVYDLGPYIADYPEQVWLSGVVQGWCPKYVSRGSV